jgi:hypothetical protein
MKKVRIDQITWSAKRYIEKCGIPINIKLGDHKEQAEWLARVIEQAAVGGEFYDNAQEAAERGTEEEEKLKEAAAANLLELTPEMSAVLLKAAKLMKKEVPTGTQIDGHGFELCTVCGAVIGQSGFYCKYCGQKLRNGRRDF